MICSKKLLLLICIVFISFVESRAQSLQWNWARGGGGNMGDSGKALCLDSKRNFVYVTGNYRSNSIQIGSQTLTNNGVSDFFVAKYDTSGNLVWAKRFGGLNLDVVSGIDCDTTSGSIYLCGTYDGVTQLGSFTLSSGGYNFFLCKLDENGNLLWAKTGTNSGINPSVNEYGNDVKVLSTSEVVMVGLFNGGGGDTLTIDQIKLLYSPVASTPVNSGDRLMLKVSSSGSVIDAKLSGFLLYNDLISDKFKNFIMERSNDDKLYVLHNKKYNPNAGFTCGGAATAPVVANFGVQNYSLSEFNSSLVETSLLCRLSTPPVTPCTAVLTLYQTEVLDMARDVNGDIYLSFKYYVQYGPGIGGTTCGFYGNGIRKLGSPERFNVPTAGKMAIHNGLIFFDSIGVSRLYDYPNANLISSLATPFRAVDLIAMPNSPKVFVTGYYTGNISVGPDILPSHPAENFVLAAQTEGGCIGATPVITTSGPTSFCFGGSVTLTAPPAAAYLWSTGETTQSITVSNEGSYLVTVFYSSGCSSTSLPVNVTYTYGPVTITPNGPTSFCTGGSVTLTASFGSSYLWNTGATTRSINVSSSGTYSVTVVQGPGCSPTSAPTVVTVNVRPPIPVINASGPLSFCAGGSVTLTAPAGYNYVWSNGSTGQSITVTTSGSYFVTVYDVNGCNRTSTAVTVTVFPASIPAITASGPTSFCQGGSVSLTASAGTSFLWSNGATTQTISVSTSGNYLVTVTNASGCSSTSAITTVTVTPSPPVPILTASGPTTFCAGGSVTLTAPAGFTYLWSNGATTQSINVNTSGSYNVRVTNANNCSATSANTTVTVNPLPAVPVITQAGNTLTSTAASAYQWYYFGAIIPGATSQSYTYTTGGEFAVTVTNAQGCTSTSAPYIAMRNAFVDLGSSERFYFSLFPNPVTTGQLSIRYQTQQSHVVGIRLVDIKGNSIVIQQPVMLGAGMYTVNANAVAERIWSGVYILEFTIDGKKAARTIIKL